MARKKGTLSKLLGTKSEYKGEKGRKRLIVKLVIYFIVWAGLLCSLVFSKDIDRGMNKKDFNFNESISAGEYKVHFIDVGQGDSSLIEFPDGKKMLIDTGEDSAENNLLRYLDSVNITTIDYLVLTHTDSDHIGNAEAVLENYDVLTVYMPTVYSTYDEENGFDTDPDYTTKETKVYSRVTEAVYKEGATVIRTFVGEDEDTPKTQPIINEEYNYRVDFYAPFSETFSDSNDYSPVIMVRFGDLDGKGENGANLTVDFMFVGDLEKKGEEEFALKPTGEEGVEQIRAILGLRDLVTNVNMPNVGQAPNLPLGAVVETNASFTCGTVIPVNAGPIPMEIYPLIAKICGNQEIIVKACFDRDLELAFSAFANDQLVRLPIDKARELFKEMVNNTKEYLTMYDVEGLK